MPVFFDLDGTLLDTAPDFAHALNKLRAKINLPPLSPEVIRPAVSEGVSHLINVSFELKSGHPQSESLRTKTHDAESPCANMLDADSLCADFLKLYEQDICRFTQPFPGILILLNNLEKQHIPWGIVTNKPAYLTNPLLNKLSLKDRAACVVSGDTTPHKKPHPAPLFYACNVLNVPPEDCIYIGDAARDIEAGQAAGMTTIGALFGYITDIQAAKQWGADHYVHTVEELWPVIQQWKGKSR